MGSQKCAKGFVDIMLSQTWHCIGPDLLFLRSWFIIFKILFWQSFTTKNKNKLLMICFNVMEGSVWIFVSKILQDSYRLLQVLVMSCSPTQDTGGLKGSALMWTQPVFATFHWRPFQSRSLPSLSRLCMKRVRSSR